MSWDIFDTIEAVLNAMNILSDLPSSDEKVDQKNQKKVKSVYITEKISFYFIIVAFVLLLIVFTDPLPQENYIQTLIIISLIGMAISFLIFFVLYQLELYHFKSLFTLILFSSSVILLSISTILWVYFKSGLFI